jgi:hypothetical protein
MLNKNSLKVVLVHVLQCWYKKIKNNNILEYTAGKKKKKIYNYVEPYFSQTNQRNIS